MSALITTDAQTALDGTITWQEVLDEQQPDHSIDCSFCGDTMIISHPQYVKWDVKYGAPVACNHCENYIYGV